MKKKMSGLKVIIIVSVIFAAVAADLSSSLKYAVEESTYRYEAEFDGVTSATSTVAIVPSDFNELSSPLARNVDPNYQQIEDMVRKAIELQGGFDWVINPGDEVMLKVNLVGGNSKSGEGENTDVRVVKALIKLIDEHTSGDVNIVVAEGTARSNDDPTETGSVWENSGYTDLLSDTALTGINFELFNLNQEYKDLIEVTLGDKGTAAPHNGKYHVHKRELEADVYIVVPVLKIHDTGLTNALKNQIGTAPAAYYGYNKTKGSAYYDGLVHDVDHRRWTTEEIVDLCAIAQIDFVVVDAIMCLEKYKSYSGSNQVRFNTIIAGADPVAVDHVSAKMMCLNPDDIAHITLAEKIGLGTNNPAQIELVGADINDVKKKVVKNSSPNGVFGQSNRTWILSKPYTLTEVAFPDESVHKPFPSHNGWSEPVYFFDDRIDLLSFYNGMEDIVTYAFTYFDSPTDQPAELWLGTHEDIDVFLNGENVHSFTGVKVFGDNNLYTNVIDIDIKEGENSLLVKTLNKYGDYSFTLNICEVESDSKWKGNRVEGLKFYTPNADSGHVAPVDTTSIDTNTSNPTPIYELEISHTEVELWPNPVSEVLNISLSLEDPAHTEIFINDMNGRIVARIADAELFSGKHILNWDLQGANGRVKSGMYVCTIITGGERSSQRLIIR